MLAARRNLSQTQIQELLQLDYVSFVSAMQKLHQSNIVVRTVERNGSAVYQVGSLVLDYLSRYHPPHDTVVKTTRLKLREWQNEQDRSALAQNTYRYGRNTLLITSNDQRIAAPHLRTALNTMRSQDLASAYRSLQRAQELTPQWWEVYRVKAQVLDLEQRPIYEVEQAFEESISCEDTDVNRFHYAVYLMGIEEYERALSQIEQAALHESSDELPLRSIKGLVLLRSGLISEALTESEYVWQHGDSTIPSNIRRAHGTQYAGALRRRAEQLYSLGNPVTAEETVLQGVDAVGQTSIACGWDAKLAEAGVYLLSELMTKANTSPESQSIAAETAKTWDTDFRFSNVCRSGNRSRLLLERSNELADIMPNSSGSLLVPGHTERLEGVVMRIVGNFGFIQTATLGQIHMDRSSLVRPSAWRELRTGQKVTFMARDEAKGPHALELLTEDE